jgi:hypothetical protein
LLRLFAGDNSIPGALGLPTPFPSVIMRGLSAERTRKSTMIEPKGFTT